jgi:hypothetical protein
MTIEIEDIKEWYHKQFPMTGNSPWSKLLWELLTSIKAERAEVERLQKVVESGAETIRILLEHTEPKREPND